MYVSKLDPRFQPQNPSNFAFPMWVSFRNLPYVHHDQAYAIAKTLGEIIGIDACNKQHKIQNHFKANKGWVASIKLELDVSNLSHQRALVDYDNLSLRCRRCCGWKHKVRG